MKYLIPVVVIFTWSCTENQSNSAQQQRRETVNLPQWRIEDYPVGLMTTDTIGLDTLSINVIVPYNLEAMASNLASSDSIGGDFLHAMHFMGVTPLIHDYRKAQSDTIKSSSGKLAIWDYDPKTKKMTRHSLVNGDTLGVNHYVLDSIHFEVSNRPMKTGYREGDSIIWNKKYHWVLEKRCVGRKDGEWIVWNRKGQEILREVWRNGIRLN